VDYREKRLARHLLAAMAYRTALALENAPEGYPGFDAGGGVPTPLRALQHMTAVARFMTSLLGGPAPTPATADRLEGAIDEFYRAVRDADQRLKDAEGVGADVLLRVAQGPLSDLTHHAGQLCLLRRLAGSPVRKVRFPSAPIRAGKFPPELA